jgi:hypothetical protein
MPDESILQEADRLVSTDRQSDYGHPREDFAKTAKMITGVLLPKLKENQEVSALEVALIMCCVKISREVNKHKRDNLVDLAGYAKTADMVMEEDLGAETASDPYVKPKSCTIGVGLACSKWEAK